MTKRLAKKVMGRVLLMGYGEGYEGRWRYREPTKDRACALWLKWVCGR